MNHHRRNYLLLVMDTVLFMNAMTFLSVNAVITLFLSELGASTLEIGLANALVYIGTFVSQPVFAKKVMNLTYKKTVFRNILFIQRIFFLAFVLTIPLFAEAHPRLMVLLFLLCWGIFSLFVGSTLSAVSCSAFWRTAPGIGRFSLQLPYRADWRVV